MTASGVRSRSVHQSGVVDQGVEHRVDRSSAAGPRRRSRAGTRRGSSSLRRCSRPTVATGRCRGSASRVCWIWSRFVAVCVSTPSCTIAWRYTESAPVWLVARFGEVERDAAVERSARRGAGRDRGGIALDRRPTTANDAASVPVKNWRPPTPSEPTAVLPSSVAKPVLAPVACDLQLMRAGRGEADRQRAAVAARDGRGRVARADRGVDRGLERGLQRGRAARARPVGAGDRDGRERAVVERDVELQVAGRALVLVRRPRASR